MVTKDSKPGLLQTSLSRVKSGWAQLRRHKAQLVESPDSLKLSGRQQRALVVTVIIALLAGFILVKGFFTVIALSALAAVIFNPVYVRLNRRMQNPGRAATLTLVFTFLAVIIPLVFVIIFTFGQVEHFINQVTQTSGTVTLNNLGDSLLHWLNNILSSLTGGSVHVTPEQLHDWITKGIVALAGFFLSILKSSFSGIANFVTQLILFMYLFTSMLTHSDELFRVFRALNPMGDKVSTLYLTRTSEMARGTVGGQLVIAACQGLVEAAIFYAAGIHYFAFFALLLSFLSVVPLGGGVVAIPLGIIMVLTGNVWPGLLVLAGHFFIITNIDNVLRPKIIPKSVRINSALMMLAVFGGIGLFGFPGIALGPIVMVLVLSTIEVYIPLAETRNRKLG